VQLGLAEGERAIAAAQVALTGVDRAPVPIAEAALLVGKPLSSEVLEEAAAAAFRQARPVANASRLPPSCRKEMARVLLRRGVNLAHRRALGPEGE
jgi:CO/xanthine dehydrogenase FAD-binding subunit